jgi:acetylornithine deacetylase/succinyl-diaminopimelate desuccinylase-like protein
MKRVTQMLLAGVAMVSGAAGMAGAGGAMTMPDRPHAAAPQGDEAAFRALYRELVETNTTLSAGSCTLAAQRVAARLRAAGVPDGQITLFATPEHPKDGGLVVVWPGTSTAARPILLLAHLDVVEAHREDWTRDPFTLIEEGGYFYGRGTYDDKSMAAVWADTIARFAAEHYHPKRTVKMALTCGEETSGAFNGAQWLSANRRELIDAAFALNEGGGGETNGTPVAAGGRLVVQTVQVGEKAYADFTLTTTNPGGHSSQPVRGNAIYDLAAALLKIRDHEFALEFNDTSRAFFAKSGAALGGEMGAAMVALAANPADKSAEAVVNQSKLYHSMLRTTCVATLIDGGHALNALPQRATANVNCRMFPGRTPQETRAELVAAIGDASVSVEARPPVKPIALAPPLDPAVIGPMERLSARHFPGVPVIPAMATWATDAVYTGAVGIPTYGVPGIWKGPDGNGMHGLNERVEVRSLLAGRAYLYDLVKAYAG